jgi:hypothetical protein
MAVSAPMLLRLDIRGIGSLAPGRRKKLFSTMPRPTVGRNRPPLQSVPGSFSNGIKKSGREAEHSTLSSAEFKNLYILCPILLHGEILHEFFLPLILIAA